MTENKRFELTYEEGKPNFWDNGVDLADCYLTCDDVVDLLNKQHEEKGQLQSRINDYDVALKTLQDLTERKLKENKQLQEERGYFERKKCEYFNKYNKKHLENIQLKEENEQLKQQIRESNKRSDLIRSHLNNEGNLTLEEYNEIIDYLFKEYRGKR